MKKILFSKILSAILVLSLILSVFVPMGNIIGVAAEAKASSYSSAFNDLTKLQPDGWQAYFSSNPQGGVAFEQLSYDDKANFVKYFTDYDDNFNGTKGYSITRPTDYKELYNLSNNWNNADTFTNMAALTYTKQKYKYFKLSIQYRYGGSGNPWPLVTFNQQNTTPEMFYSTYGNTTNPTYSEDPIAVSPNASGTIRIFGKKASGTGSAPSSSLAEKTYYKMEITVTPGKIHTVIYKTDGAISTEYTTALANDYKGGYITLMLNGINNFKDISISKVDYESDYSSAFNDLTKLQPDGWNGYYSSNPQGGVAFEQLSYDDKTTFAKYFSDAQDNFNGTKGYCITRSTGYNLCTTSNNYANEETFTKMAALTYTKQKYKYFKLSVMYRYDGDNMPWPLVTFNQQNTTPEMFYSTYGIKTNPTYSEDPIAVSPNASGTIRVFGKKANGTGATPSTKLTTNSSYYKMEITVTPGKVYTVVYNADGSVSTEYTTALADDYKGGYITLMLNGQSRFKEISIVEYPEISIDNYNATPDGNGGIATDKVMLERTYGENIDYSEIVPERAGYSFMGFYSDAEYNNKLDLDSSIDRKATIYTKWSDFADITADGSVDVIDLVRIKKMASGAVVKSVAADLDFDGTNAGGSDLTVLRKKLIGTNVASNVASAAELMNDGILYPLGRTMVLNGAVEMDHVNTGFVLKGEFEGEVKAEFTTNRTGTLLNVSVDGGENEVVELSLDGLTTLATDLPKGEHTIEVISGTSTKYSTTPDTDKGTQAFDGTLQLNKLYYSGIPATYESSKASRILFIGDETTCGMGLGTSLEEGGYKESNSYYSYASVLGRMLDAEVEVNARCGAKVCHFVWADCGASNNEGRGKGLCNGIDWLKSINVRNNTEYDYANNQPDLVVINLGTNDIPYEKDENGKWVGVWDDTGDKYSEEVPPLLNRVHTLYPNAKIIWTVGMMDRNTEISQEYIGYFKSYVEAWSAENDNSAYFLDLSPVADRNGHNGHPTMEGHNLAATEIYDFILENDIGINLSNLAELNSVQKKK